MITEDPMPRKSRIDTAGAIHHVKLRGIERGAVFRGDSDRDHLLERFGEIIQDTQTPCYAWALIPNHLFETCLSANSNRLSNRVFMPSFLISSEPE
jgi:hypothetical protein